MVESDADARKTRQQLLAENRALQAQLRRQDDSDRLLQDVIDGVQSAVSLKDLEGRFLTINRALELMLGISRAELKGKTDFDLFPPEVAETYRRNDRQVIATDAALQIEEEVPLPDGPHDFLANKFPLKNSAGEVYGVGAISHDLTDRKRTEEALRQSEATLRAVLEQMPSGVTVRDARTGALILSNTRGREILGDIAEGPEQYAAHRSFHADGRPYRIEEWPMARALGDGVSVEAEEMAWDRTDGTRVTTSVSASPIYDAEGRPACGVLVFHDITERKRTEEALNLSLERLRLSEEKFAAAFANNPAAIALTNRDSGVFVEVNDTWVTLNGYRRDEAIGRSAATMHIWPDDEGRRRFIQALLEKGVVRGWEQEFHRKSGEVFVAQLSAQTLTVHGEPMILSTLVDITDRRRAEQRLEKYVALLQAAHEEQEAFSYTISHDLRAPLRAIHAFASLLAESVEGRLDPSERRHLDLIQKNAARMGHLIHDLLQFSRTSRTELKRARLETDALVREVWNECVLAAGDRRIELRTTALPAVTGDRALLRQVFGNLIGNAIKFTRPRDVGVVEVGVDDRDGDPVFYVRDNGVGFNMRYVNKLFGVFQRLHSDGEFEGTGAGLAIVRRIVERHGGRVWAEGRVGEGAAFYFTLGAVSDPTS